MHFTVLRVSSVYQGCARAQTFNNAQARDCQFHMPIVRPSLPGIPVPFADCLTFSLINLICDPQKSGHLPVPNQCSERSKVLNQFLRCRDQDSTIVWEPGARGVVGKCVVQIKSHSFVGSVQAARDVP